MSSFWSPLLLGAPRAKIGVGRCWLLPVLSEWPLRPTLERAGRGWAFIHVLGTAPGWNCQVRERTAEPEDMRGVPNGCLMSVTYPGHPQRSHLAAVGLGEATRVLSTAWSRNQIFHQNSETLQLSGKGGPIVSGVTRSRSFCLMKEKLKHASFFFEGILKNKLEFMLTERCLISRSSSF